MQYGVVSDFSACASSSKKIVPNNPSTVLAKPLKTKKPRALLPPPIPPKPRRNDIPLPPKTIEKSLLQLGEPLQFAVEAIVVEEENLNSPPTSAIKKISSNLSEKLAGKKFPQNQNVYNFI